MPRPNTRIIRLVVNLFMARFSPADIDRVTRTPLRVGLAGDADLLRQFRQMVVLDRVPAEVPFPSLSPHPLPPEDPSNHWHILDDCQLVVVLLRREDLLGDVIYRVQDALPKKVPAIWAAVGQIEPWLRYEIGEIAAELKIRAMVCLDELTAESSIPLLKEILKGLGGYDLAAARKMPLFRDLVASRVISRTARQNLMIAMASAIPTSLPWIGPIVGLLGVTAEIVFLTSNQLRMVLQLASIYDQEMKINERMKELIPVVGSAFGWRALARELVGFVPAVGPGIKGSIAFAATHATGEAARWYYKTGTHMDPEERRRIYQEALEKAGAMSDKVAAILPSLEREKREAIVEGDTLPAWTEAVLESDEDAPREDAVAPREDAVAPREDAVAPREDAVAPREDAVAPREDAVAPREDAVAPRERTEEAVPPGNDGAVHPSASQAPAPAVEQAGPPAQAEDSGAEAKPGASSSPTEPPSPQEATTGSESPAPGPRRSPRPKINVERNARRRATTKPLTGATDSGDDDAASRKKES